MASKTKRQRVGFNAKSYDPQRWKDLPSGDVKEALGETSQKVAALATGVDTLPMMQPGFIMPWLGDTCPPGWELVTELVAKVMIGTSEHATDIGSTGGTMSHEHAMPHTHAIAQQAAGVTGSTNVDAHQHAITAAGDHNHHVVLPGLSYENMENAVDGGVYYSVANGDVTSSTDGIHSHGGATGNATSTAHTHTTAAHDHGAVTGGVSTPDTAAVDHTPAFMKLLFCRRVL